jgi:hypothetical protein
MDETCNGSSSAVATVRPSSYSTAAIANDKSSASAVGDDIAPHEVSIFHLFASLNFILKYQ